MSKIIEFILQYIPLDADEMQYIEHSKLIKEFKKEDILLREGQYANQCFFVLEGCVRSYYLINGEEKNTEFFTENATIVPISYRTKTPSTYFISCLEDAVISIATPEQTKALISQVPKLKDLVAHLNEKNIVQKQLMYDDFKNLTPAERYLKLLHTRPDIIDRIPQYHIATFLGITPVSLSRLRKRLHQKNA